MIRRKISNSYSSCFGDWVDRLNYVFTPYFFIISALISTLIHFFGELAFLVPFVSTFVVIFFRRLTGRKVRILVSNFLQLDAILFDFLQTNNFYVNIIRKNVLEEQKFGSKMVEAKSVKSW